MPRNLESREPSSADNQDNPISPVEEPQLSFLEGYRVHEKDEAKRAAEKKELRTGEKGIAEHRTERIQAYLDRLENVFLNKDEFTRERNIELLKPLIHKNTVIKTENFPDSYFEFQKQQAKERGLGDVSFNEQEKKEEIEKVQKSQEMSLDSWIDYLSGNDCKYPTDIKYFAMQGVLKLGKFDTEKYSFAKRGKDTAAPFPEIDREALSAVLGALDAKHHNGDVSGYSPKLIELINDKKGFGDMYAETMRDLDSKADKESLLPITDGEWKVFEKGSDPKALSASLAGKRSNICIADIGSATRYLEKGSVEIFFSNNHAGNPTVPRIAVALTDQGVYEVRGTYNKSEDVDPYISQTDTLSKRIREIPGGEGFLAKDACMKKMTAIDNKAKKGEELTSDELRFLYEMDGKIEGFGYQKDPRIEEMIHKRNKREDIAKIFNIKDPSRVSLTEEEAIKGNILFHYGDLNLNRFSSAEDLKLPELVYGNLSLFGLTSAEGLKLPESVNGNLDLSGLTSAEGLKLPESVNGNLYLHRLTSAEDLKLPESINGGISLSGLTSAEGLKLPESINGGLYLNSLISTEGLKLPKFVKGDISLSGLTSAEGLELPESFNGSLSLNKLKLAVALKLPKSINGNLYLNSLISTEGLELPESIEGNLNLEGLTSAEGLELPKSVRGYIYLDSLNSAEKDQLKKRYPNLKIA